MKKDIKRDEYLGAVKIEDQWHLLALYIGEWILDYPSYDPISDKSEENNNYRQGLWVVDESNSKQFLQAMSNEEMSLEDIKRLVKKRGVQEVPLTYVVNFDEQLFVDGQPDRDIEEYVPANWKGIKDFPLNYVPDEIKDIWVTSQ